MPDPGSPAPSFCEGSGMTMTQPLQRRPAGSAASAESPDTSAEKPSLGQRLVTGLLVVGPIAALAVSCLLWWGEVFHLRDLVLVVVLYAMTGHGATVGFHRLFTHRSFKANRGLKIALAVAGSMAVQGSIIGWVANHRRHHMFSDQPGDPHSPYRYGESFFGQLRGFAYAHVGWLFVSEPTSAERFAPDLLRDRDLVLISRLFPALAVTSLAIPFAVGWAVSGTLAGGLGAFLWGGLVRMTLLHHTSWSVNSICHMFGSRPSATKDQSRNFAPLAVLSMGESWHNFHHACPSSARHGVSRGQLDSSAALIRLLERAGWATDVRWPTERRLAARAAP
ncbi:MAG: acyl-CoA desaturase [Acidimicrobiia bacterium]